MSLAANYKFVVILGPLWNGIHHEVGHELRSPAEDENGGILFPRVLSSTRHSRARGNPGSLRRINLDTRFREYDGTLAGLFVLIPKRVFSKENTKSTKVRIIHRGGAE